MIGVLHDHSWAFIQRHLQCTKVINCINYMDSFFLNTYMYFGEKLASQITFECLFLQMKGKVPYILQNNGDLMINAEFLFNLIPHMMFRDKFVIVDYL